MANTTSAKPLIAAVIPCYRETDHILDVLAQIGPEVDQIYVIDDACLDGTGKLVKLNCTDKRIEVIVHAANKGVGGATLTGYRRALNEGAQIIVKLDGDGQMDPLMIPRLIQPILDGLSDYAKGNRFHHLDGISGMPTARIIGNFFLSFASKLSSGYWNIFDPTNGFTAIDAGVAQLLPLDRIASSYFFESDILFHLGQLRAVVHDVPMNARYGNELSGIRIPKIIPEFLARHLVNTYRRIFYAYFVRNPGVATLQLVAGKLLLLFGLIFGAINWIDSVFTDVPATAGTVTLAALPIILGTQLLVSFLNFDSRNIPSEPLQGHDASN